MHKLVTTFGCSITKQILIYKTKLISVIQILISCILKCIKYKVNLSELLSVMEEPVGELILCSPKIVTHLFLLKFKDLKRVITKDDV